MKFLLPHLKLFFTNQIGWLFAFANLFLATWGLAEKGWNYSVFHFTYEPVPIKILTIINLPAIVIGESLSSKLFPVPASSFGSAVEINNSEMSLIVIFNANQW